jgi:uncharacterized membrane protein YcaP (DUF421 family)
MSPATILRAALLYLFLIFVTRIVGRRPGKQITPFEFVLVFYLGGLCLTAMVGLEASVTNAACQIMCIALAHYGVTRLRTASPKIARVLDGTPLILLEGKMWRAETMRRMRIGDADVMNMARDQGLKTLDDIDTATLERNGEISIIPAENDEEGDAKQGAPDGNQNKKQGEAMPEDKDKPRPVGDTVPKVDNAIAVGEDLEFQRGWWKFENFVWTVFAGVLLADVAGLLGNGPLAHVKRATADGSLLVQYDRIERETTPVELTVQPGPGALKDGKLTLFVSDSLIKELGAQRVAPQPAVSAIGNGGITYEFPATGAPASIHFGLQPSAMGVHEIRIGLPGGEQVEAKVLVLP